MNILETLKQKLTELITLLQANSADKVFNVDAPGSYVQGGPVTFINKGAPSQGKIFTPTEEDDKRIAKSAENVMVMTAGNLLPATAIVRKIAEKYQTYDFTIESAKPIEAKGETGIAPQAGPGYEISIKLDGSITTLHLWPDALKEIAHEVLGQDQVNEAAVTANDVDNKGWVMLAPYGDWPHPTGTQRFQKPDANILVNEFNAMMTHPRYARGLPWYVGHPDHPDYANKYVDHGAVGHIKEMQTRENGIFGRVKFNSIGKSLVADERYDGHSVNWFTQKVNEGGQRFTRPRFLKSVGFTNQPNLPVPLVTEANEKQKGIEVNLNELRKALGLPDEATEEQCMNGIEALQTTITANEVVIKTATKERDEAQAKVATITTQADTVANEKKAVEGTVTELTGKITAQGNEITGLKDSRALLALTHLMANGKVLPADKDSTLKLLANEYEPTFKRLNDAKPVIHTTSVVGNLGSRNAVITGIADRDVRLQKMTEQVNERMEKHIKDNPSWTMDMAYNRAHSEICKEHPELITTK
jgi:hypothetical protein